MQTIMLKTASGQRSVEATDEDMLYMQEVIRLGRMFEEEGYELSLVGGPVRDLLLGKTPQDLDMTSDAKPRESEKILREWGESFWDVGRKYGTIGASKTIGDGLVASVEVTTYRKDTYDPSSRKPRVEYSDRLEEDLSRRDFTVNAIALRLPGLEIVDPYGGEEAIAERRLSTPQGADVSFSDDPLRMMRACRFAAKLGFEPDEETRVAMHRMAGRIRVVSAERVRDEITKILLSSAPVRGLELMLTSGLMGYVLPEVEALRVMDESSRGLHKKTFDHTMIVLKRAIRFEGMYGDIESPDLVLRLAALMHDVGKPATRKFYGRKPVTFDEHESVGADLTRTRLKALRFDKKTIEDVTALVAMHMRFHGYVTDPESSSMWTDSAVRRYVRESGDLYSRLNALTRADSTTRKTAREQEYMRRMDAMEARVVELKKQEDLDSIRPELDGVEIMRILGLKPGPVVGKAVKHMLDYRLERGEVGRETAEAELRKWAAGNL